MSAQGCGLTSVMPGNLPLPEAESFGHYRPIRRIGQGATSVVFEGRREDAEFTQRVAIKVVLDSRPSSLSAWETRILARLEHPNIARLLDAGATRSGVRFLVTEFVDGTPCTDYANAARLDERERLHLFLQICDAVQYANSSLVIHCDLKPANVLVSSNGAVKLLDFGIARLLSEAASDGQTRARFYSPNYASPEQMLGRPLGVATDVYSLGALLGELVSGQPHQVQSQDVPAAAGDTDGEGPADLPLRGDLARIARKALRTNPSLRYATVADLAADVRRYLEGRPVEARPLSRSYRLWKFVGRNRTAVLAGVLAVSALMATTAFALRQRALAQERFAQVRALANSVLFEVHDEIAKLPGSLAARHVLVNRSVEYLDALAKGAGSDDGIQLEAARGFMRLADIEGVGNEPSLGRSSQALAQLERADGLVKAVIDRHPRNQDALRARYEVLEALATVYSLRADPKAVPVTEELLKVAEALAAARPNDGRAREERAMAIAKLANTYTQSATHWKIGVEWWQRAAAEWRKLAGEQPDSLVRKRELARSCQYLAGALLRAVRREEARTVAQEAYRRHKELAAVDDEESDHMLATDVGLLANLAAQLKRFDEAVPLFQEQLRIREGIAARDPNNTNAVMGVAGTLDRIGLSLVRTKKPEEGLTYLQRSLATQRTVLAKDPENILVNREMLYVLTDLTEVSQVLNQRDQMCRHAREARQIMQGPISRARETPTDAAKKALVRKALAACGA